MTRLGSAKHGDALLHGTPAVLCPKGGGFGCSRSSSAGVEGSTALCSLCPCCLQLVDRSLPWQWHRWCP